MITYNYLLILSFLVISIFALFPGPSRTAHAATFTVDSTADAIDANPGDSACDDGFGNCTLRAAIMETNALPGADSIALPAGTYTITIPQDEISNNDNLEGDFDIDGNLTINGAGADSTIINGGQLDRVFEVLSGVVEINNLTVTNGKCFGPCGGGGFWNSGDTIINSSAIIGNTAGDEGGGIMNQQGSLTLNDTTIDGNSAVSQGGGIENRSGATLIVNYSAISNNCAFKGGGINNLGTLTVMNSTIEGNT